MINKIIITLSVFFFNGAIFCAELVKKSPVNTRVTKIDWSNLELGTSISSINRVLVIAAANVAQSSGESDKESKAKAPVVKNSKKRNSEKDREKKLQSSIDDECIFEMEL